MKVPKKQKAGEKKKKALTALEESDLDGGGIIIMDSDEAD